MLASRPAHRHVRLLVRVVAMLLVAAGLALGTSAPSSATVPRFGVDLVTSSEPGTLHVAGWAFDPDIPSATLEINVYIGPNHDDGHGFPADAYRPDVHQVHGTGEHHGFDKTLMVRPDLTGPQQVWIVAHNVGSGEGAITIYQDVVTIGDSTPTGAVELLVSTQHRTLTLAGWASDPNAPSAPVEIHTYIGGDYNTAGVEKHIFTANVSRSDGRPGFNQTLTTAKSGPQQVNVYAINAAGSPGNHRLIASRQIEIYVDTTAPETTITSAPWTVTTNDVVRVTFRADEAGVTFECRWDQEVWFACQSGTQVTLTPGKHQISVRGTDVHGNQEPYPAVFVVSVVAAPTPSQPPPPTTLPTARTVTALAVKKKTWLRIDVGPDSASTNHRVRIQRRVDNRWRTIERVRTRGDRDVVVVNLRRGTYRVVLPRSTDGPAVTSNKVRLKR